MKRTSLWVVVVAFISLSWVICPFGSAAADAGGDNGPVRAAKVVRAPAPTREEVLAAIVRGGVAEKEAVTNFAMSAPAHLGPVIWSVHVSFDLKKGEETVPTAYILTLRGTRAETAAESAPFTWEVTRKENDNAALRAMAARRENAKRAAQARLAEIDSFLHGRPPTKEEVLQAAVASRLVDGNAVTNTTVTPGSLVGTNIWTVTVLFEMKPPRVPACEGYTLTLRALRRGSSKQWIPADFISVDVPMMVWEVIDQAKNEEVVHQAIHQREEEARQEKELQQAELRFPLSHYTDMTPLNYGYVFYAMSGAQPDYNFLTDQSSLAYHRTSDRFAQQDLVNSLKPKHDENIRLAKADDKHYFRWMDGNKITLSHYNFQTKSFHVQLPGYGRIKPGGNPSSLTDFFETYDGVIPYGWECAVIFGDIQRFQELAPPDEKTSREIEAYVGKAGPYGATVLPLLYVHVRSAVDPQDRILGALLSQQGMRSQVVRVRLYKAPSKPLKASSIDEGIKQLELLIEY